MKRKLGILGLVIVVVLAVGSFLLYFWMGKPLYEPGHVRAEHNLAEPLAPPAQPEGLEGFQVSDQIRLHSFSSGEGPVALVVHGGPGFPPGQPWSGLEPLAENFKLVYYHQRGSGKSTRPLDRITEGGRIDKTKLLERTLGLGAQIADIERIRRILGQEKLILIGHSFGAFIVALYAAEFPERVRGMLLVAPGDVVIMPQEADFFAAIRKLLPEDQKASFDDFKKRYFSFGDIFDKSDAQIAALNLEMVPFWSAAAKARGAPPPELPTADAGGWMVFAMYFSMGWRHDYSAPMREVTVPVVVIHGERDIQSEAQSRHYVDYFPNSRLEVIEGVGHFPYEAAPDRFAVVARRALEEMIK